MKIKKQKKNRTENTQLKKIVNILNSIEDFFLEHIVITEIVEFILPMLIGIPIGIAIAYYLLGFFS